MFGLGVGVDWFLPVDEAFFPPPVAELLAACFPKRLRTAFAILSNSLVAILTYLYGLSVFVVADLNLLFTMASTIASYSLSCFSNNLRNVSLGKLLPTYTDH